MQMTNSSYSDSPYTSENISTMTTTATTTNSNMSTTTATATNTMNTMGGKTTPPRHNYHNPNTPIASIKRPRSNNSTRNNDTTRTPSSATTPLKSSTASANAVSNSNSHNAHTPSTPMSIVGSTQKSYYPMTPGAPSTIDEENATTTTTTSAMMLASPTPTARRGRHTSSGIDETELSPMHGVRPVTNRDIHDIPHTLSNASLLHDIDEAGATSGDDDHDNDDGTASESSPPKIKPSSSWVAQKVDALFSPVYQFLHHEEQEQKMREQKHASPSAPRSSSGSVDGASLSGNDRYSQSSTTNGVGTKKEHDRVIADDDDDDDEDYDETTPMDVSTATPEKDDGENGDISGNNDDHRSLATNYKSSARSGDTYGTQPTSSLSTIESNEQQLQSKPSKDSSCSAGSYDVEEEDESKDNLDTDQHHTLQTHSSNELFDDEDDHSMGRPEHPTDIDEFNPWQFIKSLPSYDRIAHQSPPVTLPPKAKGAPEKTVVLDLDETLVHCTVERPDVPADLTFPVVFHGITYTVHVKLRPYLQEFLQRLHGKFEVIVFTASQKVYADELLNLIDPEGTYIQHRLFRESCLAVDGNFLKDLNVLGRDLSKTVLVDNSPHAFGYQVDNGIPIESWFDCPNDRELLKLERFLRTLIPVDDVRPVVRDKFQSHKLIEETSSIYG